MFPPRPDTFLAVECTLQPCHVRVRVDGTKEDGFILIEPSIRILKKIELVLKIPDSFQHLRIIK